MSESERVPWKESNLALIGTDLDHKIKAAAAENEAAWNEVGQVCLFERFLHQLFWTL